MRKKYVSLLIVSGGGEFHYKQGNKNEIQVSRLSHGILCYPMFWVRRVFVFVFV